MFSKMIFTFQKIYKTQVMKYHKNITKISQKYMTFRNMLPPVPQQKFIDVEVKKAREKEQQMAYEAECELYKKLENVDKISLVLHSLTYTHEQYQLFVPDHV